MATASSSFKGHGVKLILRAARPTTLRRGASARHVPPSTSAPPRAAGWLPRCPFRAGGREIKICSAPLSEQHSSAGLDAAAQRRKKGRKCLFRRFPGKPGRPGGKRLLGRRTSISGPATTERGSLRAHLAELVAGPSIAALYPPRVGLPCAILPRPRERQAAGWLLHCPLRVGGRDKTEATGPQPPLSSERNPVAATSPTNELPHREDGAFRNW